MAGRMACSLAVHPVYSNSFQINYGMRHVGVLEQGLTYGWKVIVIKRLILKYMLAWPPLKKSFPVQQVAKKTADRSVDFFGSNIFFFGLEGSLTGKIIRWGGGGDTQRKVLWSHFLTQLGSGKETYFVYGGLGISLLQLYFIGEFLDMDEHIYLCFELLGSYWTKQMTPQRERLILPPWLPVKKYCVSFW